MLLSRLVIIWTLTLLTAVAQLKEPNVTWQTSDSDSKNSTELRRGGSSYIQSLQYKVPTAATSLSSFTALNPHLPKVLPDLPALLESAEVSSRYAELYAQKLKVLKRGELLTPHNYYDCQTALRLAHPKTGRKVLLLQADMDVVTDGSDPKRSPGNADYDIARSSDWYLPETAYSWARSGGATNPFASYYPDTLTELETLRAELVEKSEKDPGVVWREMIETCDSQIYRIKARGLTKSTKSNLQHRRFLLATEDPFVVLPIPWANKSAAWSPKMGDYAAVIYQDKVYPAILGDLGPRHKVGEASLRLARKLNPKANGKTRAVSDLTVTYLFFPKTAGPRAEPDLKLWHRKVSALLNEIGGLGANIQPVSLYTSPSPRDRTRSRMPSSA